MAEQTAFDLPPRTAMTRNDYLVAPGSSTTVETVRRSDRWPDGKLLLIGPRRSGKTHLAGIWAVESGALMLAATRLDPATLAQIAAQAHIVVEDADATAGDIAAETALFHLHNLVQAARGRLLLTAALPPAAWGVTLPDLLSRMQATATAHLAPPDDALLSALLVKLFADRQIAVPAALIPWMVARMDRSFAAAADFVTALDRAALAQGRAVSRSLAAEVLDSHPGPGA